MIEMPNCIGCGTTIQTEDQTAVGYAPPSSLEKDVVICQRCFRLKNYNEIQPVSLTDDDFLRILNGLGTQQGLIVKIVDIFDFNGSWLPGLHRFVGKNPVLLIANKADLLPKSVKPKKVINWLKREAKALGLQPVDVLLVSAHKGKGMAEAMEAIDEYRQGHNVYVVGCTNVGKSTFINRIIKQATGEGELARFDFIQGDRSAFTIHVANDLPIHRTKLEKADILYVEHKGELLAPPTADFIDQLPPLVRHEFSIKEAKTDVVFSGLGWITIQHANVVVAAYAPKGVQVSIRPSLI